MVVPMRVRTFVTNGNMHKALWWCTNRRQKSECGSVRHACVRTSLRQLHTERGFGAGQPQSIYDVYTSSGRTELFRFWISSFKALYIAWLSNEFCNKLLTCENNKRVRTCRVSEMTKCWTFRGPRSRPTDDKKPWC